MNFRKKRTTSAYHQETITDVYRSPELRIKRLQWKVIEISYLSPSKLLARSKHVVTKKRHKEYLESWFKYITDGPDHRGLFPCSKFFAGSVFVLSWRQGRTQSYRGGSIDFARWGMQYQDFQGAYLWYGCMMSCFQDLVRQCKKRYM